MIRLSFLLRRRAGMSREEFSEYWRDQHGPLVASHATRLGIVRYVQSHTIEDASVELQRRSRGEMEAPYDGIADLWFEGPEAIAASGATEAGRAAGVELLQDEERFIDLPNSPLWLGHELPQINPSPEDLRADERSSLVKLCFPWRARADLGEEKAKIHWFSRHGPIARRHLGALGIQRYLQVHRTQEPAEEALRASRRTAVDGYCGIAELWFRRGALAALSPEGAHAGQVLLEDEARFIDFARSSLWMAKEHTFVDHF